MVPVDRPHLGRERLLHDEEPAALALELLALLIDHNRYDAKHRVPGDLYRETGQTAKLYKARSRLYRSQSLQVNSTKYSLESSRAVFRNVQVPTSVKRADRSGTMALAAYLFC